MSLRTRLATLLTALFGRFTWTPPTWAQADPSRPPLSKRIGAFLGARRRPLLAGLSVCATAAGVTVWVATRPQPPPPPDLVRLSATVAAPSPPPRRLRSEPEAPISPLVITFDGSAAPLDRIDKPVTQGVALSPPLEGDWTWMTERAVAFRPRKPWPIGQRYRVRLEPTLVARPNLELLTRKLEFSTEPFRVDLEKLEFYQDPVDPAVKQVIGTFRFNYPVDATSLDGRLSLVSHPASDVKQRATHHVSTSYDDLRFEAYVRSESLPLPIEDHLAVLTLAPGAHAEGAPEAKAGEVKSKPVAVPGRGNRFKISSVTTTTVPDAEGNPDQVLSFSCTSEVNEQKFAVAVKAWVLPKDLPAVAGRKAVKGYRWASAREVGPEVLKVARPLALKPIPGERELGQMQSFTYEAPPAATLFVRVEGGLEAFGGYVLLKTHETMLAVPEFPRELRLAHQGAVLSLSGDAKLTVAARGLPAFKASLYRVLPKDLNHVVSLAEGDFAHLSLAGSFNAENVSEVFTQVTKLDGSNPRAAQYAAIDFQPYLKEGGEQRGLYFVRVEAWNPTTNSAITRHTSSAEKPPPDPSAEGEDEPFERVENEDHAPPEGDGDSTSYGDADGDGDSYGEDPQTQLTDRRFILLTDLGVIDKVSALQNRWVYVQSFRTGQPVSGAQVEVLAKNGTVVQRASTSSNGAALLLPLTGLAAEKTPVALLVRSGDDLSFLPLNRAVLRQDLDLSRFDVGGVRTRGKGSALSAYAFSDRGLYRPGETAHLAALVRAVDWRRSMQAVPLELAVSDPRGLVVKRERQSLGTAAFATLDFTPEASAPTGTYTFTVSVAEPKKAPLTLGSASFRVEEFLPDRLRMTSRFDGQARGWVVTPKLKAEVQLQNLFGTPAAGHTVTASFTLSPYAPSFAGYAGYTFFDPAHARASESQRLADAQTDAEGHASFDLDLSSWAPQTWQVSFYAEGSELGGGRSVSSVASVVVSPRKFLLGSKADGDLDFVKRGTARAVELIAVDPNLEKVRVDGLKAVVVEQRYVSVLMREANGTYRYQSVLKDVTRKSDALSIGAQGTAYALPSSEVGTFYLSVRDADDVELQRVPFMIAGEANVSKDLEKNAELKVSLDKSEYEPGETMTLQITAPYAGSGVITVERDKVYAHKPFTTTTTNAVQTIEVPADLEANGYVSVAFVRSIDSPELYVSPLSYGVVPFRVLRRGQQLAVTLTTEALARPGRPLSIKYRTERPSKIVVYAVDEGILQVAQYSTPDPLGFFLARRALEVTTRQIVDLLLPEFRLVGSRGQEGGDDDAAALARNLNPFKRKADAPAVYWSGLLDAGPDEQAVTFTVPESFAGALRVMAVAAAPDAMGAATTSSTIRGPYVVAPNTPTFISPRDTLTVTATIANNVEGSGEKAQVLVKLEVSAGFTLRSAPTQTLTIPEGREGVASFEVKATDILGDGTLRFLVSGSKQEATRTAHVSVRPASPYQVRSKAGSLKDAAVELPLTRALYDRLATRSFSVSLLPLGLGGSMVDYLENYPHLCSEQLSSRAAPALVFLRRPEWGYPREKAQQAFDRALSILEARQNEEGGFGYWAANSFVSEPLDVYIALMLTEARERGVAVPGELHQKVVSRLKRLTELPVADLTSARLRAQTLYVLARNEVVMPAPTAQLAEWLERSGGASEHEVALVFLAATWRLTNNARAAQPLIARFTLSDTVAPDVQQYFDGQVYWSQVLYLTAKHFPDRLDAVGPKVLGLLAQGVSRGLHSLSAAWSLYALDAYATAVAATSPGGLAHVKVEAKDAQGQWAPLLLAGSVTGALTFSGEATALRVSAKDGPMVFYSLTEGGFDREPPTTAQQDGLEVIHTLEDDRGQPATGVALGDEVNVRVKTRSLGRTAHHQVAVVDLLPSGFEVVLRRGSDAQGMDRLVSQGATWHPQELDAREDRVVFYGTVEPQVRELTYRIKAVAKGRFVVPPTFASGMYDPLVQARSTAASVVVE